MARGAPIQSVLVMVTLAEVKEMTAPRAVDASPYMSPTLLIDATYDYEDDGAVRAGAWFGGYTYGLKEYKVVQQGSSTRGETDILDRMVIYSKVSNDTSV